MTDRRDTHTTGEAVSFTLRYPMRVGVTVAVVALALVALIGALLVSAPLWQKSVLIAGALALSVVAVRSMRSAIVCDEFGILARDIGAPTRNIPWNQVVRFQSGKFGSIEVELADGGHQRLMSYATLGDVSAEQAALILNEQMDRLTGNK